MKLHHLTLPLPNSASNGIRFEILQNNVYEMTPGSSDARFDADGTVTTTSAMKSWASQCSTRLPGKCAPHKMAVVPGRMGVRWVLMGRESQVRSAAPV
jgi:hypothetical protein